MQAQHVKHNVAKVMSASSVCLSLLTVKFSYSKLPKLHLKMT